MSTWNYRVMRTVEGVGMTHWHEYSIYEVYSRPRMWSERVIPTGETLEDLKSDYDAMGEAFNLPVLDYKTCRPIKEEK